MLKPYWCYVPVDFADIRTFYEEIAAQNSLVLRASPCCDAKIDGKRTDQCNFPANRGTPGFRPCHPLMMSTDFQQTML